MQLRGKERRSPFDKSLNKPAHLIIRLLSGFLLLIDLLLNSTKIFTNSTKTTEEKQIEKFSAAAAPSHYSKIAAVASHC